MKGLYEKAFKGEIKEFTGVSDPYEVPSNPEIVLKTEEYEPQESARIVLERLEEMGPPVRGDEGVTDPCRDSTHTRVETGTPRHTSACLLPLFFEAGAWVPSQGGGLRA